MTTQPKKDSLEENKIYVILDMGVDWRQILSQIPLELCSFIQLRDKYASDQQMLFWGQELQKILPSNVILLINDRVEVAKKLGVGVHLGMDDMSPKEARKIVGNDVHIGLTIHNRLDLAWQNQEYIDYVGVGPVFPTNTKLNTKAVLGIERLKMVQKNSPVPVVAIGGINQINCQDVWKTGVKQIAVCSAIMRAKNPTLAAVRLQNLTDKN